MELIGVSVIDRSQPNGVETENDRPWNKQPCELAGSFREKGVRKRLRVHKYKYLHT